MFDPFDDPNNIRIDREMTFADGNSKKVATLLVAHDPSDAPDKKRQLFAGWRCPVHSPVSP